MGGTWRGGICSFRNKEAVASLRTTDVRRYLTMMGKMVYTAAQKRHSRGRRDCHVAELTEEGWKEKELNDERSCDYGVPQDGSVEGR